MSLTGVRLNSPSHICYHVNATKLQPITSIGQHDMHVDFIRVDLSRSARDLAWACARRNCEVVYTCAAGRPADLQTADNSVLRDAWPSTGVSCWATGPVSRIDFTLKSSVYWPIIGLGTRTWSVAMRCRDPAGQSEFFVRVLHLKTFNWMYCYREFIVGIVVSAIAVFRLVDNILSSCLHC